MTEAVEIPARLAEAMLKASLERQSGATPGAAEPVLAFTTADASTPLQLDSTAITALVSLSLQHEATLHEVASRVGMSVDELVGSLQRAVREPGSPSFTDSEMSVFAAANVDLTGPTEGVGSVELAGRAAAHRLISEALTVDEAAGALGVTPGRIRQRLSAGELVHLRRADGQAVLPRWQICDGRVVPRLQELFADAPDLHPLVVARFMTAAHPDLELDEEAVSPIDWLLTGGEVEPVAELLHSIALRG